MFVLSSRSCKVAHLIGCLIFSFHVLFFFWYIERNIHKTFSNGEVFYDIVLEVNSGVDAKKWDIVKFRVNKALYGQGIRKIPYYFFNSLDC